VVLFSACQPEKDTQMPSSSFENQEPVSSRLLEQSRQALEEGNLTEARRMAEEAFVAPDTSPEAAYLLGYILQQQGEHAGAIDKFTMAIQSLPECGRCYNNRALSYEEIGDPESAETDLRQAIEIDPGLADAYYNLGLMR